MLPYICPLQGHPSPKAHTLFSKMPLCVCPCQGLYMRFHAYAHCKDTPLQMHIHGSQKFSSLYAHVRVSICASIHMPTARTPLSKRTYVVLKNATLCMPMSGSLYALPYICPCKDTPLQTHIRGSQKCPSVYAHVRVSICASIHMPTARTTLAKRTYVVLKNARVYAHVWVNIHMPTARTPLSKRT